MFFFESSIVWLQKITEISCKNMQSYLNPDVPSFTFLKNGSKLLISIQNSYLGKKGLLLKFCLLVFSIEKK